MFSDFIQIYFTCTKFTAESLLNIGITSALTRVSSQGLGDARTQSPDRSDSGLLM